MVHKGNAKMHAKISVEPKGCTEGMEMMPSKKMCITKKKHIRNY